METGLTRLWDLFVEGTEAYMGNGPDDKPVVVWMNKLNGFEVEEANRDASLRRAERMSELGTGTPEQRGAAVEVGMWTDQQLREAIVVDQDSEITAEAFDNLYTAEDWRELEDYVQRAPMLLADESVKPGDPRFATLEAKTNEYTTRLTEEIDKVRDEHIKDLAGLARESLEEKFWEGWRQRRSADEWRTARRTTELFLSARKCNATKQGGDITLSGEVVEEIRWDHSACDHSERFYSERASVLRTPDQAMRIMAAAYERILTPLRSAGNSDAPASSSESSEPSSAPEEASTASFREERPVAVRTT